MSEEGKENESRKRSHDDMEGRGLESEREDGLLCPVCLDAWTSVGPHRLCSLRCGHLFGLRCVQRWLGGNQKTCPTCNTPARKSDIREIYAAKLIALDTSELEDLRIHCSKLQEEKQELLTQLNLQKAFVAYYKEQYEQTKENITGNPKSDTSSDPVLRVFNPRIISSVRLDEGVCRVMAYCAARDILAVSQENVGPLWPGFGIRLLSKDFSQISALHPVHRKELRDLVFHPNNPDLLLSVSLDKSVKVFDLASCKVVFSWAGLQRLWSCCWDSDSSSHVFVGTERGCVVRLDTVSGAAPYHLPLPVDKVKPVAVIALRSSRRLGCILCCRIMSLTAYHREGSDSFRLQLLEQGRFSAMAFSEEANSDVTLVLTCRPRGENSRTRHICLRLEVSEGSVYWTQLHVLFGGDLISQLSRSTIIPSLDGGNPLYFAYDEASSTVCGWYVGQENKVVMIKTHSFVRDVLAVRRGKQLLLNILTPNFFKCYDLNFLPL